MLRVALVEDDIDYTKELTSYLERYEKEYGEKINISVFADGDEIVEDYTAEYDIILMDIEMKFMDGMTAAEKIRESDNEVVIVFITNTPQFVMQGYKVDALDYVLKPITYFAFSQRINRAIGRLKRRTSRYMTIPIKGGMQKLDVSQIYYIEIYDHELTYYTRSGMYVTRGTMRAAEKELEKEGFFRCNKCYLVNLKYIEKIENNKVFVGKDIVQVSRARKKILLDALNDYINEVGK